MKILPKILALSLFAAAPAIAMEGWQKAKWGMTQEEAKKAWPELTEAKERKTYETPLGVQRSGLVLPEYPVGEVKFSAEVLFGEDGKFCAVKLTSIQPDASMRKKHEQDFLRITDLLTRKYGSPDRYSTASEFDEQRAWQTEGMVVHAIYLYDSKKGDTILLSYQAVSDDIRRKLDEGKRQWEEMNVLEAKKL